MPCYLKVKEYRVTRRMVHLPFIFWPMAVCLLWAMGSLFLALVAPSTAQSAGPVVHDKKVSARLVFVDGREQEKKISLPRGVRSAKTETSPEGKTRVIVEMTGGMKQSFALPAKIARADIVPLGAEY